MKPAILHREAKLELHRAAKWYNEQRLGLGRELLDEVDLALDKIERDPGIGVRLGSSNRRFYRLKRFRSLTV